MDTKKAKIVKKNLSFFNIHVFWTFWESKDGQTCVLSIMSRFHKHVEYLEVDPCSDNYNNYRVIKKHQATKAPWKKKKLEVVEDEMLVKNIPWKKKLVVKDGTV